MVDSNIVYAGLLRAGSTRRPLVEPPVSLMSPEWMVDEILGHESEIARRAGLAAEEVRLLLWLLTRRIEVVPREAYEHRMTEARARLGSGNPGDAPFLALALARACDGIWTQNTRDFRGAPVRLWSTAEVVAWVESQRPA